jgi:hypothetical protein
MGGELRRDRRLILEADERMGIALQQTARPIQQAGPHAMKNPRRRLGPRWEQCVLVGGGDCGYGCIYLYVQYGGTFVPEPRYSTSYSARWW